MGDTPESVRKMPDSLERSYLQRFHPTMEVDTPWFAQQVALLASDAAAYADPRTAERANRGWCAVDAIRAWLTAEAKEAKEAKSAALVSAESPTVALETLAAPTTATPPTEATAKVAAAAPAKPQYADLVLFAARLVADLDETKTPNVRREAIAVFTWPRSVGLYETNRRAYIDWVKLPSPHELCNAELEAAVRSHNVHLAFIEGKIYLEIGGGFRDRVWKACADHGTDLARLVPGMVMAPNTEKEHVTFGNSDVVARLGLSVGEWAELLGAVNARRHLWKVRSQEFQHTLSLDYAPILACVVLPIVLDFGGDPDLQKLDDRAQKLMGRPAFNATQHLTIATIPRAKPIASS